MGNPESRRYWNGIYGERTHCNANGRLGWLRTFWCARRADRYRIHGSKYVGGGRANSDSRPDGHCCERRAFSKRTRRMQIVNMSSLRKISRPVALTGLCGIVALFLYASVFGGNRLLPPLYYIFVALLVVGAIGTLLPRWLQLSAAIRENEKKGVITPRRKYLLWLGLLFCALPVPWLFFVSREFGGPPQVNPMVAYIPAIGLLVLGIFLLFYSYFAWLRAVRSLQKKWRDSSRV